MKQKNPNIFLTCKAFLSSLSVDFSEGYIEEFLTSHKDYPSLSSISALLNDYGIENASLILSENQLFKLPFPCVAYIGTDTEKNFVLLQECNSQGVKYCLNTKIIDEPLADFYSKWQRVVLVAEPAKNAISSGDQEYRSKRKRQFIYRAIIFSLIASLLISILMPPYFLTGTSTLILTHCIGLFASILLFRNDLGIESSVYNNICSLGKANSFIGCEKVATSKASSVFGLFRMSELGCLYFAGGLIFLTFKSATPPDMVSMSPVYLLTLAALPYTIFSLYYQATVVKQFCPLCLIVVFILWSEFVYLYFSEPQLSFSSLNKETLTPTILSFLVPVVFWLSVKDEIFLGYSIHRHLKVLSIFKESPGAMAAMLQENRVELFDEIISPIVINQGGTNKLNIVLSLFCGPCSATFQELHENVSRVGDIEIRIILIPSDTASEKIIRYLLAYRLQYGEQMAIEYLKRWYDKTVAGLSETPSQSSPDEERQIDRILQSWRTWLTSNQVRATPTVYINGNLKPDEISLKDLRIYFRSLVAKEVV